MSKKENYANEHRHRAIIGFDENGIPRVLKPVEGHTHTHTDVQLPVLLSTVCTEERSYLI